MFKDLASAMETTLTAMGKNLNASFNWDSYKNVFPKCK